MRVASGAKEATGEVAGGSGGGCRIAGVAVALCAGLLLASCAGTSSEDGLSAYVADHWPRWAGGMPADVPPRPGAPGYQEFIAHGQADQGQPPAGANGAAPVFETAPAASAQPPRVQAAAPASVPVAPAAPAPIDAQAEPPQPTADDSSVVHGGLY